MDTSLVLKLAYLTKLLPLPLAVDTVDFISNLSIYQLKMSVNKGIEKILNCIVEWQRKTLTYVENYHFKIKNNFFTEN